jgi:hypothetical protein
MTEHEQRIMEAIRKSDAFGNAVTALVDSKRAGYPPEPGPAFWPDIHRHVIPALEAAMREAGEEAARLKKKAREELV